MLVGLSPFRSAGTSHSLSLPSAAVAGRRRRRSEAASAVAAAPSTTAAAEEEKDDEEELSVKALLSLSPSLSLRCAASFSPALSPSSISASSHGVCGERKRNLKSMSRSRSRTRLGGGLCRGQGWDNVAAGEGGGKAEVEANMLRPAVCVTSSHAVSAVVLSLDESESDANDGDGGGDSRESVAWSYVSRPGNTASFLPPPMPLCSPPSTSDEPESESESEPDLWPSSTNPASTIPMPTPTPTPTAPASMAFTTNRRGRQHQRQRKQRKPIVGEVPTARHQAHPPPLPVPAVLVRFHHSSRRSGGSDDDVDGDIARGRKVAAPLTPHPPTAAFFALRDGNSVVCAWDASDPAVDGPDCDRDCNGGNGGGDHRQISKGRGVNSRKSTGGKGKKGTGTWSASLPDGRRALSASPITTISDKRGLAPDVRGAAMGVCGVLDDGSVYVALLGLRSSSSLVSGGDHMLRDSNGEVKKDGDGGKGGYKLAIGTFGSSLVVPEEGERILYSRVAPASASSAAASTADAGFQIALDVLSHSPSSLLSLTFRRHVLSNVHIAPASVKDGRIANGDRRHRQRMRINPNEAGEDGSFNGGEEDEEEEEAKVAVMVREHTVQSSIVSLAPSAPSSGGAGVGTVAGAGKGTGAGAEWTIDAASVRAAQLNGGGVVFTYRLQSLDRGDNGKYNEKDNAAADCDGDGGSPYSPWFCAAVDPSSGTFLGRPFQLSSSYRVAGVTGLSDSIAAVVLVLFRDEEGGGAASQLVLFDARRSVVLRCIALTDAALGGRRGHAAADVDTDSGEEGGQRHGQRSPPIIGLASDPSSGWLAVLSLSLPSAKRAKGDGWAVRVSASRLVVAAAVAPATTPTLTRTQKTHTLADALATFAADRSSRSFRRPSSSRHPPATVDGRWGGEFDVTALLGPGSGGDCAGAGAGAGAGWSRRREDVLRAALEALRRFRSDGGEDAGSGGHDFEATFARARAAAVLLGESSSSKGAVNAYSADDYASKRDEKEWKRERINGLHDFHKSALFLANGSGQGAGADGESRTGTKGAGARAGVGARTGIGANAGAAAWEHDPRQLPAAFVRAALPVVVDFLLVSSRGGDCEMRNSAALALLDLLRSRHVSVRDSVLGDEETVRDALRSLRSSWSDPSQRHEGRAGVGDGEGAQVAVQTEDLTSIHLLDAMLHCCPDSIPERVLVAMVRHVLGDVTASEVDRYFHAACGGAGVEEDRIATLRKNRDEVRLAMEKLRTQHEKGRAATSKKAFDWNGENGASAVDAQELTQLEERHRRLSDRLLAYQTVSLIWRIASYSTCNLAMLRSALQDGLGTGSNSMKPWRQAREDKLAGFLMRVLGRALSWTGVDDKGGAAGSGDRTPAATSTMRIAGWISALADAHLPTILGTRGETTAEDHMLLALGAAQTAVRDTIAQAQALSGADMLVDQCIELSCDDSDLRASRLGAQKRRRVQINAGGEDGTEGDNELSRGVLAPPYSTERLCF